MQRYWIIIFDFIFILILTFCSLTLSFTHSLTFICLSACLPACLFSPSPLLPICCLLGPYVTGGCSCIGQQKGEQASHKWNELPLTQTPHRFCYVDRWANCTDMLWSQFDDIQVTVKITEEPATSPFLLSFLPFSLNRSLSLSLYFRRTPYLSLSLSISISISMLLYMHVFFRLLSHPSFSASLIIRDVRVEFIQPLYRSIFKS